MDWNEIEDRLEEAALTLRRLPDPAGSGARGYGSAWPEVVREARHAYGYERARMRVRPSPREITRYEEAVGWLALLSDPLDRRIVWLRAEGWRWSQVCRQVGLSRPTASRRFFSSLITISKRLNAKDKSGARWMKHASNARKAANIERDKFDGLRHE